MIHLPTKKQAVWCALLCAVCILLALLGNPLQVQAAGTGSIYGSSAQAEKGGEVTVSFSISNNPGIWGLKASVSYDSSVMTLKSVSVGNVFAASEVLLPEGTSQNPYSFLATGSSIENKTGNGSIIKMTFAISASANLGDYAVNISVNQAINIDEQDVSISASGAKISVVSCLHSKSYLKNFVASTETEEGYSGDSYCSKCGILLKKGSVTPLWVNTCEHENAEWTVTQEPACEEDGKKELICPDCEKHVEEEIIEKTGHEETEIVDDKAPTTTEEGYTGDVKCKKCEKIIEEGTVIEKIPVLVFQMATLSEDTYIRNSEAGLVFVSDADLETFVRVEIDGTVLDTQSYILESGSTKVTLTPEYLETLADGKHTITIVSDAGTASAQFQVMQKQPNWTLIMLIITVIAVVVAAGCLVYILIPLANGMKKGRYSSDDEA